MTDTPERQELAAIFESRKRKATCTAKKPKQCLFKTKGKRSCPPTKSKTPSSSEGDDSEVEHNDESDVDSDTPIIEGDFVVIKCAGKSRFVHYIARVDVLSGDEFEFEGVFLHKVAGKVGSDRPVFVPDTNDEAAFDLEAATAPDCR